MRLFAELCVDGHEPGSRRIYQGIFAITGPSRSSWGKQSIALPLRAGTIVKTARTSRVILTRRRISTTPAVISVRNRR